MSKYEGHTPGPWEVRRRDEVKYVGGKMYGTPYIYSVGDKRYIAEVNSSHLNENKDANAKLIADAPMLAEQVDKLESYRNKARADCIVLNKTIKSLAEQNAKMLDTLKSEQERCPIFKMYTHRSELCETCETCLVIAEIEG